MYEFLLGNEAYQFDLDNLTLYYSDKSYSLNRYAHPPKNRVYFKLTRSCNLTCIYCFQKTDLRTNSPVQIDKFSDSIDKLLAQENTLFYIFGGEPFLDSQYENIQYLLRKGSHEFYVFTNGCFSAQYRTLIPNYIKQLKFIITLDGTEMVHNSRRKFPAHNSFQMIVDNLDFLRYIGATVILQINVDISNLDEIVPLFEFINNRYGINCIDVVLNPVLHCSSAPVDLLLLEKYVELDNRYGLSRCTLNNKVVKKLTRILSGQGIDCSRCNVDRTYVIDFESKDIYCCPQSKSTKIGQFSEHEICIDREVYNNAFLNNQKLLEPCYRCRYRTICGYGCVVDTTSFSKCHIDIENQLQFILKNINHFMKY